MANQSTKFRQVFLATGAIMGWFTLLLQFYLLIGKGVAPIGELILRYFGYFTILTNILVTLYCTVLLLKPAAGLGNFFSSPKGSIAITIYISFVGLSYQFLLRHIWEPQGLDLLADELLHTIIPAFFIVYWFLFAPRSGLAWKNVIPWLVYPACYLLYTLFRGALSGWYPYPFIHVGELGYNSVIKNSALLLVGFILLSLFFVAIAKIMNRMAKG